MGPGLIISWEKISSRSRGLSEALGWDIFSVKGRIKYLENIFATVVFLWKRKPRIVIVQVPPGPLLLIVLLLRPFLKFRVFVDMHTGFLVYDSWKGKVLNKPFIFLLGYADQVLVHNINILQLLSEELRSKVRVIYDPIIYKRKYVPRLGDYILLVSTFSDDEDLDVLIKGYLMSEKTYPLLITGNYNRKIYIYNKYRRYSDYVRFLGWVSNDDYEKYLASSRAVVTNSIREYTMQRAIWEAASYKKLVIIPGNSTHRDLLLNYPVYYDPSDPSDIKRAFNEVFSLGEDQLVGRGRKLGEYLVKLSMKSLNQLVKIIDSYI